METKDELIWAVRKVPEDLDLRRALAQALVEGGDPLGRYIQLQLDGTPGSLAMAAALFAQHREAWLGPWLPQVLADLDLRGGFLFACSVAPGALPRRVWARARGDRGLLTLQRLVRGQGELQHYRELVVAPTTANLVEVEVPTDRILREMLLSEASKRYRCLWLREPLSNLRLEGLAGHPSFQELRALGLPVDPDWRAQVRGLVATLTDSGLARIRRIVLHADALETPLDGELRELAGELGLEEIVLRGASEPPWSRT